VLEEADQSGEGERDLLAVFLVQLELWIWFWLGGRKSVEEEASLSTPRRPISAPPAPPRNPNPPQNPYLVRDVVVAGRLLLLAEAVGDEGGLVGLVELVEVGVAGALLVFSFWGGRLGRALASAASRGERSKRRASAAPPSSNPPPRQFRPQRVPILSPRGSSRGSRPARPCR
jgi:hypothetical protein